jgi:hypothetical protein
MAMTRRLTSTTDSLVCKRLTPLVSKRYCQDHHLPYHTEHELVVDYLGNLHLEDYIGSYDPRDVLVLADSGYDDKKIENAVAKKLGTSLSLWAKPAVSNLSRST